MRFDIARFPRSFPSDLVGIDPYESPFQKACAGDLPLVVRMSWSSSAGGELVAKSVIFLDADLAVREPLLENVKRRFRSSRTRNATTAKEPDRENNDKRPEKNHADQHDDAPAAAQVAVHVPVGIGKIDG